MQILQPRLPQSQCEVQHGKFVMVKKGFATWVNVSITGARELALAGPPSTLAALL